MRGAPRAALVPSGYSGIIPAYAGSTPSRETWAAARTDHPRVCGEHLGESVGIGGLVGSSPRMRGARVLVGGDGGLVGIIPAYAGSTSCHRCECPATSGSSPRMRGALIQISQSKQSFRIIPAYAGSTRLQPTRTHLVKGSSPRMRGAPVVCSRSCATSRIIPAYAGSTLHEVHRSDSKAQFVYGCQGSANQ